jgi:hypothetical protein
VQSNQEKCNDVLVSELPTASLAQPPAFDVAGLPAIDSIGAGSDIRAFLEIGVPPDLTRAALRRAWLADPAISNFVGLSENSWDFNVPGAIPGFGSIDTKTVANMVARVLGGPDAIATGEESLRMSLGTNEDRAGAPIEGVQSDLPAEVQILSQARLEEPSTSGGNEITPDEDVPAAENSASCGRSGSEARRKHGGALPQLP